ncbi:MAG TPA: L,D-transpeptidase [Gemmatimonadota bacterium]|nr:L,D-transpeptidase [Gemmatimonadota bacterium]
MRTRLRSGILFGLLFGAAPAWSQESDPITLLVSVSERELSVRRGEEVLHRFPVGVGTGERLSRAEGDGWNFSTPTGVFEIGRMKKDPVWYAPDWYYVERGLPVPPAYSDERYRRGILGDYALYLSDEIAIHGTRDESSVGRASSHGCLRMRNADIAIVFPLVQVGTRVDIVP